MIRSDERSRARSPDLGGDADLHVMMNMFWEPLDFEVPVNPQRTWHVAVDTFAPGPRDIADSDAMTLLCDSRCTVHGRSIVILVGVNS